MTNFRFNHLNASIALNFFISWMFSLVQFEYFAVLYNLISAKIDISWHFVCFEKISILYDRLCFISPFWSSFFLIVTLSDRHNVIRNSDCWHHISISQIDFFFSLSPFFLNSRRSGRFSRREKKQALVPKANLAPETSVTDDLRSDSESDGVPKRVSGVTFCKTNM